MDSDYAQSLFKFRIVYVKAYCFIVYTQFSMDLANLYTLLGLQNNAAQVLDLPIAVKELLQPALLSHLALEQSKYNFFNTQLW